MEAVVVLVVGFLCYGLGWWARGFRSITLEDIAREIEAADRDEPLEERARRAGNQGIRRP